MTLHKPGKNGSSGRLSKMSTAAGTWLQPFPSLWEFLTCSTWPDGEFRSTGSLLIFSDNGFLKACLTDKNGPRKAFVSGPDPDSLLLAVEEGLELDTLDWRPDFKGKGKA